MDEEDWVVRGEKGGEAQTQPLLFIVNVNALPRESRERCGV